MTDIHLYKRKTNPTVRETNEGHLEEKLQRQQQQKYTNYNKDLYPRAL